MQITTFIAVRMHGLLMEQPLQRKITDCYAVCELVELILMIRPGPWIRPNLRIVTVEVKETNCVKEYENTDKVGLMMMR